MQLLIFLLVSCLALLLAYRIVGGALARACRLTSERNTPAHTKRDGIDYEPARVAILLPQHFSAIAAAGPIVGPILAAIYFGWGPAWLWIIFGGIFIGGVHDFLSLVGSVRHGAQSVAAIIRRYMNPRSHTLFLIFVWFSLVYVIVAFTDVTAGTFVQQASVAGAQAPGPAVATSSMLYLGLAFVMGAVLRHTGIRPSHAKAIFLPLVLVSIVAGVYLPLDISGIVKNPQMAWGYILLIYCFVAAMVPLWLLLQPRGELGGYFLYIVMLFGGLGIIVSSLMGVHTIRYPFFTGWHAAPALGGYPLFPILFITVACGACSGFHSILSSGTTSKQLDRERDAQPVAYGGMLLETLFACISLATIMIVVKPSGKPDAIYAAGIADFARRILSPVWRVSESLAADAGYRMLYQFALLCFATFVFDTLDVCTRLARYVLMEAFGWKGAGGRWVATFLTLAIPALVLIVPPVSIGGVPQPLWRVFWGIFGSSNQLLAALALLGLTFWLARTSSLWWVSLFPCLFMMVMTQWSLLLNVRDYVMKLRTGAMIETMTQVQFVINCTLLFLSIWLLVEAVIIVGRIRIFGKRDAHA